MATARQKYTFYFISQVFKKKILILLGGRGKPSPLTPPFRSRAKLVLAALAPLRKLRSLACYNCALHAFKGGFHGVRAPSARRVIRMASYRRPIFLVFMVEKRWCGRRVFSVCWAMPTNAARPVLRLFFVLFYVNNIFSNHSEIKKARKFPWLRHCLNMNLLIISSLRFRRGRLLLRRLISRSRGLTEMHL